MSANMILREGFEKPGSKLGQKKSISGGIMSLAGRWSALQSSKTNFLPRVSGSLPSFCSTKTYSYIKSYLVDGKIKYCSVKDAEKDLKLSQRAKTWQVKKFFSQASAFAHNVSWGPGAGLLCEDSSSDYCW